MKDAVGHGITVGARAILLASAWGDGEYDIGWVVDFDDSSVMLAMTGEFRLGQPVRPTVPHRQTAPHHEIVILP